jgi:hypothetical protein
MGQDAPVEWNRTYGSFADGSARRMELVQNNHRLTTHDGRAITAAMNWFASGLGYTSSLSDSDHVYLIKETLILIAMLSAMASMLPLFLLLTRLKFFAPLGRPVTAGLPSVNLSVPKMLSPKKRRTAVLTAILVSGLTFPFLSQLGHGLFPFPDNIFRMTVGDGFVMWLSFLMLVSLFMLLYWYKKGDGKRDGWTSGDLGLAKGGIVLRAIMMAFVLTGAMYVLVCVSVCLFKMDFRFIWPFFKPFTLARFGQFLLYLPFYTAFFLVNAGIRLYGQMRLPEYPLNGKKSAALTQLAWWGYSVLVMLGGVFLIALIEYIPFFMGIGPGADLLFSSLFGGPFMSVMILLIPQFAVFFFFSTWFFRKSGTVYTGSFIVSILASWVLSGGSAMF